MSQEQPESTEEKPKRRGRKWLVLLVALSVGLLLGLWWWYGTGSTPVKVAPDTTVITSPLKPDGMPDYVAWLNEHYSRGVTPENNAAVLLIQVFGPEAVVPEGVPDELLHHYGLPVLPRTGDYFVGIDGYFSRHPPPTTAPMAPFDDRAARERVTRGPWTAQAEPEMAAWLAANQAPLALLAQAAARPRCFIPYHSSDPNFPIHGMLLPALGPYMEACRALLARSMLRLGANDPEGAWADLMTIRRLAPILEQQATLFSQMVAILIDELAGRGTRSLAAGGRLSGAQARRMAADLAALPEMAGLFEPLDGSERFGVVSAVINCSRSPTIDLSPLGLSSWEFRAVSVDWNEVLREINRLFDQAHRAAAEPTFAARMAAADALEARLRASRNAWLRDTWWSRLLEKAGLDKGGAEEKPRTLRGSRETADYFIAQLCVSDFGPAISAVDETRMNRGLDLLSLALAAHRAEKGEYPAALADLAPGYLKAVPEDLFVGKPLVYRRTADGYLLYSVGPNMTDDGGEDDSRAGKDDLAIRVPAAAPPAGRP